MSKVSIQFFSSFFPFQNSMQSTSQKTNAYTVEVVVKDSAKAFEKARDEAIAEIAENVSFRSSRKGNVPKGTCRPRIRRGPHHRTGGQLVHLDKQYHKILERRPALVAREPMSIKSVNRSKSGPRTRDRWKRRSTKRSSQDFRAEGFRRRDRRRRRRPSRKSKSASPTSTTPARTAKTASTPRTSSSKGRPRHPRLTRADQAGRNRSR